MSLGQWPHRLLGRRAANRVLVVVGIACVLVLGAGEVYQQVRLNDQQARTDAFLQGRLNSTQSQIDANGQTLAQAEVALAAAVRREGSDITALKAEVSALQAKQADLEAQIAALRAGMAPTPSPAPSTPSVPSVAPTAPPRPSSHGHQPPATDEPMPTPVVCPLVIVCFGNQSESNSNN